MNLTVNSENVAKCAHFCRFDAIDNADVLRHLISLVGDGVAQLVFQYSVVHVECLYCKRWKFHRILA